MIDLISLSRREVYAVLDTVRKRNYSTLKPIIVIVLMMAFLVSCGSKKPRVVTTKKRAQKERVYDKPVVNNDTKRSTTIAKEQTNSTYNAVIGNARAYKGTKYKYGGSTRSGMDCSGLIHIAFKESGTTVPRTSRSLYDTTKKIPLDRVEKGDLLFFATGSNRKKVNHVALVTNVTPAEITFIHSTTSRGVIESTLNEMYWVNAFLSAGRLK